MKRELRGIVFKTTNLFAMIRNLVPSDIDQLRLLAELARSEGFHFLDRFVSEVQTNSLTLDSPGEFFLAFVMRNEIVGIGGVTPDPYVDEPRTGRLRHVYVRSDHRRGSVGRQLVRELEMRAQPIYATLRLRTDTVAAARFYEALGYDPIVDPTATHVRRGE